MPILQRKDSDRTKISPGVGRWQLVDAERGAESLTVADLTLAPGSMVPAHMHPTEEAMVILEGELEAVLGNDTSTVRTGQTVMAPAMVRHGFVNRSGADARLMAIFPTARMERVPAG